MSPGGSGEGGTSSKVSTRERHKERSPQMQDGKKGIGTRRTGSCRPTMSRFQINWFFSRQNGVRFSYICAVVCRHTRHLVSSTKWVGARCDVWRLAFTVQLQVLGITDD